MPEVEFSDNYKRSYPSDQNALDIFKQEWSSKLPESMNLSTGGQADLFEDQRITWAQSEGVDFKDKHILELGPLEAGHTWMMEQLGAQEILAIEAHERAYLKCLVVKEITGMKRARFLHGDFDLFLKQNTKKFNICLASGVLYHSTEPVELLNSICQCSDCIILWTHYYDHQIIQEQKNLANRFEACQVKKHHGITLNLHPFRYTEEIEKHAFCGGLNKGSVWLERPGIESILRTNNFEITSTGFDHPNHPNGPAIALVASKSS